MLGQFPQLVNVSEGSLDGGGSHEVQLCALSGREGSSRGDSKEQAVAEVKGGSWRGVGGSSCSWSGVVGRRRVPRQSAGTRMSSQKQTLQHLQPSHTAQGRRSEARIWIGRESVSGGDARRVRRREGEG